jgi:hypothetical protein
MLPNVRGLITTQDGASILFEFRGRTIFEGDEPGRQNLVGWFESDHESYHNSLRAGRQYNPAASPMTTVHGRMVHEVTKPLRT